MPPSSRGTAAPGRVPGGADQPDPLARPDVQVEGGSPELQDRIRGALTEVAPQLYRPEAVARDQQRLLQLRGVRNLAKLMPEGLRES